MPRGPAWMPRTRTHSIIYLHGRPTLQLTSSTTGPLLMHISPLLLMKTLGKKATSISAIMIWDYYDGKIMFVTGGTGFIGTAILYRLLTQATPEHIYVLCRGGYS